MNYEIMKYKINFSILIVALLATLNIAYPKNYFISSTGNDSATGNTVPTAWKTIEKLNSIDINPGDRVFFEGGKTFYGSIFLLNTDANDASNTVVITSYGNQKATINSGANYGFYAYNTQGFTLRDLIFEGSGMSTNTNDGVVLYADISGDVKLFNISLVNLEIKNYGKTGLVVGSYNKLTGYHTLLIDSVKVHDVMANGIVTWAEYNQTGIDAAHHDIAMKNCEVYNIPGFPDSTSHKGSGIIMGDVNSGIIENCVAYNNGEGNTHCGGPGGIWAWSSNRITIQFCESHHNHSGAGCDGVGFDLDGGVTNSTLQYNYSHDNDGSGILLGQFENAKSWFNNVVRYNISENDGRTNGGGITLFKGPNTTFEGLKVYHNSIYLTNATNNIDKSFGVFSIIDWNTGINGVEIYNNIFQTKGNVPLISIPKGYNPYFAGNLYWSSGDTFKINYQDKIYSDLSEWRSSTGNEKIKSLQTGIVADPMLINPGKGEIVYPKSPDKLNAYSLANNSPAINAGLDLKAQFGIDSIFRDFFNNNVPIGNAPDIGAYESSFITSINDIVTKRNVISSIIVNQSEILKYSLSKNTHSIEMFTIDGALVWNLYVFNENIIEIPTNELNRGYYFLIIQNDDLKKDIKKILIE
jgi:hypothetical protein